MNAPRKVVHGEEKADHVPQRSGNWIRVLLIGVLLVVIGVLVAWRMHEGTPRTLAEEYEPITAQSPLPSSPSGATAPGASPVVASQPDESPIDVQQEVDAGNVPAASARLPKLLDLGAKTCIPCKMMAPILDELRTAYAGDFDVVFIDVRENREPATRYGIQAIPTQIFFDANGSELRRHVGFFSKEDILSTWQEVGFQFERK